MDERIRCGDCVGKRTGAWLVCLSARRAKRQPTGRPVGESIKRTCARTHTRTHRLVHFPECILTCRLNLQKLLQGADCDNDLVISCLCLRSDGRASPAELLLSRLSVYRRKGFDSAPQNKTSPSRGSTSLVLRCSV